MFSRKIIFFVCLVLLKKVLYIPENFVDFLILFRTLIFLVKTKRFFTLCELNWIFVLLDIDIFVCIYSLIVVITLLHSNEYYQLKTNRLRSRFNQNINVRRSQ